MPMRPTGAIALVGLPGGGKSTVGRLLAKRLGWTFADSDTAVVEDVGCSVRSFFERFGEEAFRDWESRVLDKLTQQSLTVVATGGGVVLREANRRVLQNRCAVIYLRSTPQEIYRRLRHDTTRPLLQVSDPRAKLEAMYAERDPLYCEVAHFVVDTGRPSVTALVNTVLMQLELSGAVNMNHVRIAAKPQ